MVAALPSAGLASDGGQLPVLAPLRPLLSALPPGVVVATESVPGSAGATTLGLAVTAAASQAGAWVAVLAADRGTPPGRAKSRMVYEFSGRSGREGLPIPGAAALGLVAAAGLGVALERIVVVAIPDGSGVKWASLLATLIDGFDVVLIGAQARTWLRSGDTRRLEHGSGSAAASY